MGKRQNLIENSFYKTSEKHQHKESFDFVAEIIRKTCNVTGGRTLCDIGCAVGDFLAVCGEYFPELSLFGIDVEPEFIELAKKNCPKATFQCGDIETGIDACFDTVVNIGMIYLFYDWKLILENLLRCVKPHGTLILLSGFNQYGYQIKTEYKTVADGEEIWLTRHEHAISDISAWLEKQGLSFSWKSFELHTEIPQNTSSLYRVWTERMENGKLMRINGLHQVSDEFALVVQK